MLSSKSKSCGASDIKVKKQKTEKKYRVPEKEYISKPYETNINSKSTFLRA